MIRALFSIAVVAFGLFVVSSCSTLPSLPAGHPEELAAGRVNCSECHTDLIKGVVKPSTSFSHTPDFVRNHRLYAGQDHKLCATCHAESFCTDCHARQIEIKPATLHGNRPDRALIHRGDFMALHRIEGKVDPGSCYRCHGRSNNEKCAGCHR